MGVTIFILIHMYLEVYYDDYTVYRDNRAKKVYLDFIEREICTVVNASLILKYYSSLNKETDDKKLKKFISFFLSSMQSFFSKKSTMPGDELIFPAGTQKHSVYVAFTLQPGKEHISISVYDLSKDSPSVFGN